MGKPITAARMEIDVSIMITKYYAENLEKFLTNEPIEESGMRKGTRYEPMGIVFMVKPFNFPVLVPFMSVPSTLAAGNKIILKPAECCPQSSLLLAQLFKECGFDGYFETLFVSISDLENVVADPRVAAVGFTGSTNAGKALSQ